MLLLLSGTTLRANIVLDGSFETPVVAAGSFQLYTTGSSFGSWTVVGQAGNVAPISGTYTQGCCTFPAEDGVQWLDLTGLSNTATGVQQAIPTVLGTTYQLAFWVGNVVDPSGVFGTTSTVNVQLNGLPALTATNSIGAGTSTQVWQQFTTTFVASSASTILAFYNGDPATDNSNGLDNISVNPITSGVPEPSTWVLMGLGLGILGRLARKP